MLVNHFFAIFALFLGKLPFSVNVFLRGFYPMPHQAKNVEHFFMSLSVTSD